MSIAKKIIIKICLFFLRLIYSILKLFPTRDEIVFISRQSNDISLDFELIKNKINDTYPNYKTVVLTKRLDNKLTYIPHIIKQMYHLSRSRLVIIDSYCIAVSVLKHKKSLKVLQIWHSVGCMKKFGYAMINKEEGSTEEIANLMCMHKNYDKVLISSKFFIKDFFEGFRIEENKVVEIPLPRVDLLLDKKYQEDTRKKLYKEIPSLKNKKNILYCTTFRKDKNQSNEHIKKLIEVIDFDKYNLLYKPHPLSKIDYDDPRLITNFSSTFEALSVADYVISDYSSIIYEIGLLKLPLYLYAYDWDEYKHKRELNLDIEKDPGLLFTSDPLKIIKEINNNKYDFTKWNDYVNKNIKVTNKKCIDRIMDLIKEMLNDGR